MTKINNPVTKVNTGIDLNDKDFSNLLLANYQLLRATAQLLATIELLFSAWVNIETNSGDCCKAVIKVSNSEF